MLLLGVGYDGANKIMSFWSLKHFTKNTYIRYAKYVTENAVKNTKNILGKCRDAVFKHYENKVHKPVDGKLDIDVTYDGSWHKRGYKSNFGIGSVVAVGTGYILHYSGLSKT